MWIMNGNETEIINTEYIERFVIAKKDDAVLVSAVYSDTRLKTVGRYSTEEEAHTVIVNLFKAISENAEFYFVEQNTGKFEIKRTKSGYNGRKVKGHGGS